MSDNYFFNKVLEEIRLLKRHIIELEELLKEKEKLKEKEFGSAKSDIKPK